MTTEQFMEVAHQRPPELEAHLKAVAEREEGMQLRIEAKLLHLRSRSREDEARLLKQATKATKAAQKVFWLRKAADAMSAPVYELSACTAGCSHCCNLTVPISRIEAEVIARETGTQINKKAGIKVMDDQVDLQSIARDMSEIYYGMPCSFLSKGRCTIYESRPLACRLLLNLDDDDLLCKITPGEEVKVPRMNASEHELWGALALGLNQQYDDIREWFPMGLASSV
ncbi:YkgJ family cysteine cluster protein [Acidovorax sp. sic0104]|uniref:YkgJ family cysteine cluster protein n=1 Tax=Acidovorax sp. sic0104 TaxID=2854784 RepID=UPI001C48664A|nr:YkgJ family cysteine cluster protein [Acidovorax sp. sic0104]MBV7542045.1 YkgJ family cysteine cluster protein [Acidovorax sp. sic0104]